MRKPNFAAVAAFLAGSCVSGFAQGAAEAVLTHSLATSVGSSIGKSLGQATNQLAGKMGQRTSQVVQKPITSIKPGLQTSGKLGVQKSARPAQPAVELTTPTQNGSLIQSIQGGEPAPSTCAAPTLDGQPKTDQAKQSNCSSPATPEPRYRSEITLPPAK